MTGLRAWPSAASRCRAQCTTSAAVSTDEPPAASTHTTVANSRSPGHCTGRVAAAVATMPVPITEANQLGPRLAKASEARSRSWSGPVRRGGSGRDWSGRDWSG